MSSDNNKLKQIKSLLKEIEDRFESDNVLLNKLIKNVNEIKNINTHNDLINRLIVDVNEIKIIGTELKKFHKK